MICPKCKANMAISEWDGWVWMCLYCDHLGRHASDAEIEAQEHETEQMIARATGEGEE